MTRMGLKVAMFSLLAGFVTMLAPGLAGAAAIAEYSTGVTTPGQIVIGADGNGWFINGTGIDKIDSSGHVTPYSAGLNPGAAPGHLTNGPNNDLWFTNTGTTKAVGYITTSGQIQEFTAPMGEDPQAILEGSDGNLWFYSSGATHEIVKMTPTGSFGTPTPMPTLGEVADNMVLGPDHDIWFSDTDGNAANAIDKISPSGILTQYQLARVSALPTNITVGPDGNLWFADNSAAIGRITTSGSVQEFTTGLQPGADPDAITAGPDGNLWFTDQYGAHPEVGRVTPAGQITEFSSGLNGAEPEDIAAGADGNLWVPQSSMDPMTPSAVAEVSTTGQITEITKGVSPTGLADGDSITPGADGSLWFSDNGTPKAVGRITPAPIVSAVAATAITTTGATISGSVTALANSTAVTIQYGTRTSLGSSSTIGALMAGVTKQTVTGAITGLPSGTLIYYRIAATNSAGETDGALLSFTTASPPKPTPPLPLPLTPSVPMRTAATFDNQQITLTTPSSSACVANSTKLSVTLSSTAIDNSKKTKLRFSVAALYLDKGMKHTARKTVRKHGRKVKVTIVIYKANVLAKKLPVSAQLKLAGLKSGSHTLRARLSYTDTVKKRGHKTIRTVAKTLTARFDVC